MGKKLDAEPMYDYLLKNVDINSLVKDKNYSRYLECLPKIKSLEGTYIAYQNGKIVYVGSRLIGNGFETAIDRASKLVCDDPVLIMQVGTDHARYLLRKDF